MLNIVCVEAGNYQGRRADYVNRLHDMVRRNLPLGFPGQFICFTDGGTEGLHPDITVRPLPAKGLEGWMNKLSLFRFGLFDGGDRILYFDLDTLITGRLDDLAAYEGPFAILRDFYRPSGLQSSIMAWEAGDWEAGNIWQAYAMAGFPHVEGGDQAWIEQNYDGPCILQSLYPDLFVSYKVSGGKMPEKASVVVMHGRPRPHEVTTGWVPEVWKIGGLMRAQLDSICNTNNERLLDNVRSAKALDLPWITVEPIRVDAHAVLVGGGPSALDFIEEIRWRQSIGQMVWALNGSAAWLRSHGIDPNFHVIVDARPENVAFVSAPSIKTTHLIGSQCDPGLFQALRGYTVALWHSGAKGVQEIVQGDARGTVLIGGGSTVGLQAMALAHALGFREQHLYGFDSSLTETEHHAYPQTGNNDDLIVDVLVGDQKFRGAPWMVQQADEFVGLARELADKDAIITVHGEGLLPYLAHEMEQSPPVTAAQIRAAEVLRQIEHVENPVGAEIGVFAGEMSAALLSRPDLTLYMVDSWEGQGKAYKGDSGDWHATLTQSKQDAYMAAAEERVAFAGDRARILQARSLDAAHDIPDGSLDFVFLDADHSETGVRADIEAWLPKLKPNGMIAGHDFGQGDNFPGFGVDNAVNAFIAKTGWTLLLGDNFCWLAFPPERASIAA